MKKLFISILLFLTILVTPVLGYNTQTGKNSNYWGLSTAEMVAIDGNNIAAGDVFFLGDTTGHIKSWYQVRNEGTTDNVDIFAPTANAGVKRWHRLPEDLRRAISVLTETTDITGIDSRTLALDNAGTANKWTLANLYNWLLGKADTDLSSVSGSHDTIATALAIKTALDGKVSTGGYGTICLTAAGGIPSTSNGASGPNSSNFGTNGIDLVTLDFDPNTEQSCQWYFTMPNNWSGAPVTAQFIWFGAGTSTDSVVWGIQGRSYGDAESIDQAFGTAQEVSDAHTAVTNQILISSATSGVTFAGTPAAGEPVVVRAYRKAADGGDTFTANASCVIVLLTYPKL